MTKLLTYEELCGLEHRYECLAARLANAIAERYEIGTPVIVVRGEKEFRGTIAGHPNWWSDPECLLIKSHTGWRFRASFRDVRRTNEN